MPISGAVAKRIEVSASKSAHRSRPNRSRRRETRLQAIMEREESCDRALLVV
jgi:hypothetical protein